MTDGRVKLQAGLADDFAVSLEAARDRRGEFLALAIGYSVVGTR